MVDSQPTAPPPITMPPQGLIAYKAMYDGFDFLKKQQWTTTNYLLLIYAAIVWLHHHVKMPPVCTCIMSVITILAAIWQIVLLLRFQSDLEKLRLRAQLANVTFYTEAERAGLDLTETYKHPFWRGWEVLVALIFVSLFGAALVVTALIFPPIKPP